MKEMTEIIMFYIGAIAIFFFTFIGVPIFKLIRTKMKSNLYDADNLFSSFFNVLISKYKEKLDSSEFNDEQMIELIKSSGIKIKEINRFKIKNNLPVTEVKVENYYNTIIPNKIFYFSEEPQIALIYQEDGFIIDMIVNDNPVIVGSEKSLTRVLKENDEKVYDRKNHGKIITKANRNRLLTMIYFEKLVKKDE